MCIDKNVGQNDRMIRAVLAAVLVLWALYNPAWRIALLVLAGLLLITVATGKCVLYLPCGINTLGTSKKRKKR